jgi:hypothetical protein
MQQFERFFTLTVRRAACDEIDQSSRIFILDHGDERIAHSTDFFGSRRASSGLPGCEDIVLQ